MHLPMCQVSNQSKRTFHRMPLSQHFFWSPVGLSGAAFRGRGGANGERGVFQLARGVA